MPMMLCLCCFWWHITFTTQVMLCVLCGSVSCLLVHVSMLVCRLLVEMIGSVKVQCSSSNRCCTVGNLVSCGTPVYHTELLDYAVSVVTCGTSDEVVDTDYLYHVIMRLCAKSTAVVWTESVR